MAQGGELAEVPVAGRAAEQQVEARRVQCLTEPAFLALAGDACIGEPVARPRRVPVFLLRPDLDDFSVVYNTRAARLTSSSSLVIRSQPC